MIDKNKLKNLLLEADVSTNTNTQQEEAIVRQVISKMTSQQWNKLFLTDMRSFSQDDFTLLQQLGTYLYTRLLQYQKNPKQYNSSIK